MNILKKNRKKIYLFKYLYSFIYVILFTCVRRQGIVCGKEENRKIKIKKINKKKEEFEEKNIIKKNGGEKPIQKKKKMKE
jgi:hypothetical protein